MTERLLADFRDTRRQSLDICTPLEREDYGLQAAVFASPPKWHLAHTTWFYETFLLKSFDPTYVTPEPLYETLFNSYYNGVGEPFARDRRGLLSRPTLDAVLDYRAHVEAAMERLLAADHPEQALIGERTRLGIEHERQHQELLYTDLKYSLAANPLYPAYRNQPLPECGDAPAMTFTEFAGGLGEIGFTGGEFCFDNELPRHRVFLEPFALADRLVTNAEYQAFIDDGGYERPEFWLADGWSTVCAEAWTAPLYWRDRDGEALEFTLFGLQPRQPSRPVCHVSGYEADAYARWADARLPRESEWEHAVGTESATAGTGMDGGALHPEAALDAGPGQHYGACWQWTQSAYSPYPGFAPGPGAIGEYNGKFMSNQWVLRGGSCVTKASQARPSYRNFFYPQDRWQFGGIRLAREAL